MQCVRCDAPRPRLLYDAYLPQVGGYLGEEDLDCGDEVVEDGSRSRSESVVVASMIGRPPECVVESFWPRVQVETSCHPPPS